MDLVQILNILVFFLPSLKTSLFQKWKIPLLNKYEKLWVLENSMVNRQKRFKFYNRRKNMNILKLKY